MYFSLLLLIATVHGEPDKNTQSFINALKVVKAAPENGSLEAAARKANQNAFAQVDAFFDFNRVIDDPIAPHKNKLSATQLKRYHVAFRDLIRLVAYPQSSTFLHTAEIKIQKPTVTDKTAQVPMHAYVKKEDIETNVVFFWQQDKGDWKIIDVSFDGASLVKDYKNQFGKIIEKEGAEGLVKKLENRLQKERVSKSAAL
jgi:phospholipid transport system substrate-binding protein